MFAAPAQGRRIRSRPRVDDNAAGQRQEITRRGQRFDVQVSAAAPTMPSPAGCAASSAQTAEGVVSWLTHRLRGDTLAVLGLPQDSRTLTGFATQAMLLCLQRLRSYGMAFTP